MKIKNNSLILLAYGLIVIVVSLLAFLVVENKNSIFWISYIFTLIAVLGSFLSTAIISKNTLQYFSINFTFISIAFIYLFIEIIVTITLGVLIEIDPMLYFTLHAVLLTVFSVISIFLTIGKRHIVSISEKTQADVIDLKLLGADVLQIKRKTVGIPSPTNLKADALIDELYEKIIYSDPTVHDSLKGIDDDIKTKIYKLNLEVDELIDIQSDDLEVIADIVLKINAMIEDRNIRAKILK